MTKLIKSTTEDKIQEIIDKVNRGEIGLDSTEVATGVNDEGRISPTVRKICGPCNINKHHECKGTPFVTATTLIIDAKAGMSSSDPGVPAFQVREFICPFCGVYAQQNWSTCRLPHGTIMGGGSRDDYPQTSHAQCVRCKKYSVWHKEKMIYPSEGMLLCHIPTSQMMRRIISKMII